MPAIDYCLTCRRAVNYDQWKVYAATDTLALFRCPHCRTAYTLIAGQTLCIQTPDRLPAELTNGLFAQKGNG